MSSATTFSFESQSVPDNWKALAGGRVETSTRHCRGGDRSLAWTWEGGGSLQCSDTGLDPTAEPGAGVRMWVYNETPIDDAMRVEFGDRASLDAQRPAYAFDFRLAFRGWRACYVVLNEDAAVEGVSTDSPVPAPVMQIVPPASAEHGTLYFDDVAFTANVGIRSADFQAPLLPTGDDPFAAGQPLLHWREQPRHPEPASVSDEERRHIETIRRRYERWLLDTDDGSLDALTDDVREEVETFIREGWETYRNLGIRVDDEGWLTGPALAMRRADHSFHDVFNAALPLAFEYKLTGSTEARDAAMQLLDYAHDQGWAEGSALGNCFLNILTFAAYCHAVYLLRDALEETGRLDTHLRAALWYLNFGKAFRAHDTPEQETNADELRSTVFTALPVILSMSNETKRSQYLHSWRDWFHNGMQIAAKFAGVIKPDGVGWHHRGVYTVAYTGEAYEFSTLLCYFLHDTPYAAEPWARDNLALALRTEFEMSWDRAMPYATRGRMLGNEKYEPGRAEWYDMCTSFAFLAMADERHREEMGGLFARMWEPECPDHATSLRFQSKPWCKQMAGRRGMLERFAKAMPEPAGPSEGLFIKPWAGLAAVRGESWLAAVKGYSQYVWDFECHPKNWHPNEQNVFARHISNGSIQVLGSYDPESPTYLGTNLKAGWDWTRWPGTTAKQGGLEYLYSQKETWQTRWFSDETFLGGVASERCDGLFALRLHDTCYDPSFYATKSYFIFGNCIVCLGSDIACDDAERPVETTLMQSFLPSPDTPVHCNGEAIAELPCETTVGENAATTLLDPYRLGYVLPRGQRLNLTRRHQHSRSATNNRDTEGDFATAWIDHGHAPSGADYEYAMLIDTTREDLDRFAADPPYRVLQQNRDAHVLACPDRGFTGAAVFSVETTIAAGPVARTDTPVCGTTQTLDDGGVELRFAVPDLRLPRRLNFGFVRGDDLHVPAEPRSIHLHLRGAWVLDESATPDIRVDKHDDHDTALTATCRYGETYRVRLKPRVS
ncbi:MAG: chondroitinase family polysaccharide lyase [Phycisphaeraceae bacterium]